MNDMSRAAVKRVAPQKKAPKKPPRRINYWRIAFLVLLGLILGTGGFFSYRILSIREPNLPEASAVVAKEGSPVISINSNKKQVNEIIDFFLQQYQKGSDIKYKFYLENEALLTGQFKLLGFPISFYLYFDPYVMDNGNVQLKASSLSVGTLGLPIKEVMETIKRQLKFPDWVEVNPDEQVVIFRLDKFQMTNGMFMKADRINLIDDDIRVSMYLPNTTKSATSDSSTSSSSKE